jgi:hypothetical protein
MSQPLGLSPWANIVGPGSEPLTMRQRAPRRLGPSTACRYIPISLLFPDSGMSYPISTHGHSDIVCHKLTPHSLNTWTMPFIGGLPGRCLEGGQQPLDCMTNVICSSCSCSSCSLKNELQHKVLLETMVHAVVVLLSSEMARPAFL